MSNNVKLRNIGPKSAAWLRQVGVRTPQDLVALGAVGAFVKVKRAGFRPSLNLLYALEGALLDCHWQQISAERRSELLLALDAAEALLPPQRGARTFGLVERRAPQPDPNEERVRFGEEEPDAVESDADAPPDADED